MRRRGGPAAADDAAVIESSWREPERFAVLFDRHAPHIYRYLARRAGRQVAEDLVAETFLVAFAKRDRYDLGHADAGPGCTGSPPTWSASIAGTRPASTVQSRLHRARAKVRQVLAGTDAGATYKELTTNE